MTTKKISVGKTKKKWSAEVTENSPALDLKKNVFTLSSAKKITESLKESAQKSNYKKRLIISVSNVNT